jgi:hypothetical protein
VKAIIAFLFVVLAAIAWASDDAPRDSTQLQQSRRPARCIDWVEGQFEQVRCPR